MSSLRISIDPEQAPYINRGLADEMLRWKDGVGRWHVVSGGLAILVTPDANKAEEAVRFEQWLWANGFPFEKADDGHRRHERIVGARHHHNALG